jgi:gliding motility-associated-like protein
MQMCAKGVLTTVVLVAIQIKSFAQGEALIWYFGNYMGYDFRTNPPTILYDGAQIMLESMATISSPSGNLLFYTTGERVWNRLHQPMPNGFGLKGTVTTSQSAIIIPKPGNPDLFYIFTADAGRYNDENVEGIHYSLVSLCQDGGLGDVVLKNTPLLQPSAEKLSAVFHANGTDVWVISHGVDTDQVYVWLVTEQGVQNPVISHVGRIFTNEDFSDMLGFIKFSPDGKQVAMAEFMDARVLVCDFDNATGKVSPIKFELINFRPYGIEFSPDGTKLYVSYNTRSLMQYDLQAGTALDVQESGALLYRPPPSSGIEIDALQLAPDGKIYTNLTQHIANPNALGVGCDFRTGITIPTPPATLQRGLSGFNQSYFDPNPYIVYEKDCVSPVVTFKLTREADVAEVLWDFGNGNTSSQLNPQFDFNDDGIFSITATITLHDGTHYTKSKKIIVNNYSVNLGPDTVVCDASQYLLNSSQPDLACYRWQDESTHAFYNATTSGLYYVEVRIGGCTLTDTVFVEFTNTPEIPLAESAYLCEGGGLELSVPPIAERYLWSTGAENNSIQISEPGQYWLEAVNSNCRIRKTVDVLAQPLPVINLPADTTLCTAETLLLQLSESGVTYTWNNNVVANTFAITTPGKYWVDATINGCTTSDTIIVYEVIFPISTSVDSLICENSAIKLAPDIAGSQYAWSTGSEQPLIDVRYPGSFWVDIVNRCFETRINYYITAEDCDCDIFIPNVFTPNGDEFNPYFRPQLHQNITELRLEIFNRWGGTLISRTGLDSQWDGFEGVEENATGVYYWFVRYGCRVGTEIVNKQKRGYVHLIR